LAFEGTYWNISGLFLPFDDDDLLCIPGIYAWDHHGTLDLGICDHHGNSLHQGETCALVDHGESDGVVDPVGEERGA